MTEETKTLIKELDEVANYLDRQYEDLIKLRDENYKKQFEFEVLTPERLALEDEWWALEEKIKDCIKFHLTILDAKIALLGGH